jgi:uncharacterized protein YoxC
MFNKFLASREQKRTQSMLTNVHMWFDHCKQVSELLDETIFDEDISASQIRVVLDRTDRMLFALRVSTTDARGSVKRIDRDLAERIATVSQSVFELRNHAVRFLIRCNGPEPMRDEQLQESQRQYYYQKALEEIGFSARQKSDAVKRELDLLWTDLQGLLQRVDGQ